MQKLAGLTESKVIESFDLPAAVANEFKEILNLVKAGQNPTDNIIDELGDYFDEVKPNGDQDLQWAYSHVRELADEDDLEKVRQGVLVALDVIGELRPDEMGSYDGFDGPE